MEITYSPVALPGSCFFCGSGNREYYIDTGMSVEFHGAMYLCNVCVEGIAALVRYIPPDDYKELMQSKEHLEEEVFALSKKLSTLEGVLRDLANAGYTVHDDGSIVRAGGVVLEDVLEPESPISIGKRELGEGEGAPSESNDDEDVGELHSNDDSNATSLFGV
jgi:hypothetical protein